MDQALALSNEDTSAPENIYRRQGAGVGEGGVFRDGLVHCLPETNKETEAQKVRGLPEVPQTNVSEQGRELGMLLSPCRCLSQHNTQIQHPYMTSDFVNSGPKEQPLN